MSNIERGQVWIETMTPKGFPTWERLHFVTNVKPYHMAGREYVAVMSSTKDGSCQTDLGDFQRFSQTELRVDVTAPCIEQRTIEELREMLAGTYKPQAPSETFKTTAIELIGLLDSVGSIGGFHRKEAIANAVKALRDVAAFCGEDVKELNSEIWGKRL